MAEPKKRDLGTLYKALGTISDQEGVDFGLDGLSSDAFQKKYGTGPGNIENLYNKLNAISDEEGIDFGQGTRDEWLASFGYKKGAGKGYTNLAGKAVGQKQSKQQRPQSSAVTNAYNVGKRNWSSLADEDEVEAPASIARPTDTYSTPGAIQRVAEQNRKDNYGQKVVDNVVTATRQEEERRNQPVVQTGNEGVDTYLMKTQGQLEDDIAKNLGGYQSQVQEFTQGVL